MMVMMPVTTRRHDHAAMITVMVMMAANLHLNLGQLHFVAR
jgi:hypothetical protein